jgi:catalase
LEEIMSANHLLLGTVIAAYAGMNAPDAAAQANGSPGVTPVQVVDALNGVFGKQTTGRAIHAKGVVLEGSFTASPEAHSVSRAPHFSSEQIAVTVRFSDFAGIPTISDTNGLASPRGMAIKFHLKDGGETDIVAHSVNAFPSPTTGDFRDLMVAIGSSPPGTRSPTAAESYLGGHPVAKSFFDHLTPPPASYATLAYYGVNSFEFTSQQGASRFGRYQIIPTAGIHLLPVSDVASADPNYLRTEIRKRLESAPATFILEVQLAQNGDLIENPSISWPASRTLVKVGVITITRVVADSETQEQKLMFSPAAVADGIRPADPMVSDRNAAYGVSYGRRHGAGQ